MKYIKLNKSQSKIKTMHPFLKIAGNDKKQISLAKGKESLKRK